MFLNLDLLNILNIYFFENIVFFYDNITIFSEISDVFFIFLYSFFITKNILFLKNNFLKNSTGDSTIKSNKNSFFLSYWVSMPIFNRIYCMRKGSRTK